MTRGVSKFLTGSAPASASCTHLGCLPRPLQTCEESVGFRYFAGAFARTTALFLGSPATSSKEAVRAFESVNFGVFAITRVTRYKYTLIRLPVLFDA